MKIYNIVLAIVVFLSSNAFSQNFEWANSMGAGSDDIGESIITDPSGNVYTVGEYQGTADFDPGTGTANLTSNGARDIFIQKLTPDGDFLWAKSIGGSSSDYGVSITIDTNGDLYITGRFLGTVDFNPGAAINNLTSSGSLDIFILKLDANGDFVWAKSIGAADADWGSSIVTDAPGNIYVTGVFGGTTDFDPGVGVSNLISNGNYEVFVLKLDNLGDFVWAVSMGNNLNDFGNAIAVDNSGNVYTAGVFGGTLDLDPHAGTTNVISNGLDDVFIQKLDPSGNLIWGKSIGGSSPDKVTSISLDSSGNIYLLGNFQGAVDFDPGPGSSTLSSSGGFDIFIEKLDPNGNFVWAKKTGGSLSDNGSSIFISSTSDIYTTGYFQSNVDFDPNIGTEFLSSSGSFDVFIQKLNVNGDFVWAKKMGGSASDVGTGIYVDGSDNVLTTGFFANSVDFDPGVGSSVLASNGFGDPFVQKLSQCSSNSGADVQSACETYTWIDGNTYTSDEFLATHTLTNVAGCDSVVTLNLTVLNPSTGIDAQNECGPYTWIDGNTYTSSNNTATHFLANNVGCDSVVTLDLTITNIDVTVTLTSNDITSNLNGATYQWLDCDNGFATISGATAQTFSATDNGNYAVEITENGCTDTSLCNLIGGIGFFDYELSLQILVYPNPFHENLTLQFSEVQEYFLVELKTITGQTLEVYVGLNKHLLEIETDYPAGVYFLQITDENGRDSTFKIVKQ